MRRVGIGRRAGVGAGRQVFVRPGRPVAIVVERGVAERNRRPAAGAEHAAQLEAARARHIVAAGERQDVRTIDGGRPVFVVEIEIAEELRVRRVGLARSAVLPRPRE